jgi:GNAT superfamily N-acetyltransferase
MALSNDAPLTERELTSGDVAAALRLSTAVQWNQTAADWAYLIAAGHGFGYVAADGTLVATAIALPYAKDVGWISMVIVDDAYRGRGLAARLVRRCIETLEAIGRVPMLDATPAGRDVYARLGFTGVWDFQRLRAAPMGAPLGTLHADGDIIRSVTERDLAELIAFDRSVFGSRRDALLRAFHARLPAAAFVARTGERVCGFCFARDGRTAQQIGPVVADRPVVAHALIANALAVARGPVVIDVPDVHDETGATLRSAGFVVERGLSRMVLASPMSSRAESRDRLNDGAGSGPSTPLGMTVERMFAVAGPEFG